LDDQRGVHLISKKCGETFSTSISQSVNDCTAQLPMHAHSWACSTTKRQMGVTYCVKIVSEQSKSFKRLNSKSAVDLRRLIWMHAPFLTFVGNLFGTQIKRGQPPNGGCILAQMTDAVRCAHLPYISVWFRNMHGFFIISAQFGWRPDLLFPRGTRVVGMSSPS
jgi:hypothetical protein